MRRESSSSSISISISDGCGCGGGGAHNNKKNDSRLRRRASFLAPGHLVPWAAGARTAAAKPAATALSRIVAWGLGVGWGDDIVVAAANHRTLVVRDISTAACGLSVRIIIHACIGRLTGYIAVAVSVLLQLPTLMWCLVCCRRN